VILSRRHVLQVGGGLLAALPFVASAAGRVEISMRGSANGSHVWFDPIGVRVPPGTTIEWQNEDAGNAHTSTAFHPQNANHPLRIPVGAKPWNSDYLLPSEMFAVTLTLSGVYDYFCIPHEKAGMVGRIVVADPDSAPPAAADGMPDAFPSVADIIRLGRIAK
jgi:plastocyanin